MVWVSAVVCPPRKGCRGPAPLSPRSWTRIAVFSAGPNRFSNFTPSLRLRVLKAVQSREKGMVLPLAAVRIRSSKAFQPAVWSRQPVRPPRCISGNRGAGRFWLSGVHAVNGMLRQRKITPGQARVWDPAGTTCAVRWACAADHHASLG